MSYIRINELRKQKGLTNKELSDISGVPFGTISKISAGITKIPNVKTMKAIADALGCTLEELDEYCNNDHENSTEKSNYYLNDEVEQMAQEIYDNPELRILFDASRKLEKEDILTVVSLVKRMKGYNEES